VFELATVTGAIAAYPITVVRMATGAKMSWPMNSMERSKRVFMGLAGGIYRLNGFFNSMGTFGFFAIPI